MRKIKLSSIELVPQIELLHKHLQGMKAPLSSETMLLSFQVTVKEDS